MNPFATGTIAGHAPPKSDGEHEEREHAENRASTPSNREDENGERGRRKEIYIYIRVDSVKRKERWTKERRGRKREREKRGSEGRQKSGRAERERCGDGPGW